MAGAALQGLVQRKTADRPARMAARDAALLVIDMFSRWRFPDGERVGAGAARIAPAVARFQRRCRKAGIAVVFVNDDAGPWRSDAGALLRGAAAGSRTGAIIADTLAPAPADLFVLKPRQSAFYATPLEFLLRQLGARRLFVAGVATEHCIASTAREAHMRDFDVTVLSDATAGVTAAGSAAALRSLQKDHAAEVAVTRSLRL